LVVYYYFYHVFRKAFNEGSIKNYWSLFMTKTIAKTLSFIFVLLVLGSCLSTPNVSRVDAYTQVDLTGRWNDTDVRMVCESLLNDCLSSPAVNRFIEQYASQNGGRQPSAIVGVFRNASSERINTSIISRNMETAIVNSGKLAFVAGGDARQELRHERQDQQTGYTSDDTAAALGHETGAILMLTGSVNSIVEQSGNTTVRAYFVDAQLTNIESNQRIWMGTNNEIKKIIRQANYRL
jgi:uncharacterized protein (TIGR02722 family)